MKAVDPGKGRATINHRNDMLHITIPSKRRLFMTAFLGLWLCGWTMAGFAVVGALFFSNNGIQPFLAFWLCGWALGWLYASTTLMWLLFGRETIEVNRDGVKIGKSALFLRFAKFYDALHITRLRSEPTLPANFLFAAQTQNSLFTGRNQGPIVFDYGRKTIKAGFDLDEAEAIHIIDMMKRAAPRFGA